MTYVKGRVKVGAGGIVMKGMAENWAWAWAKFCCCRQSEYLHAVLKMVMNIWGSIKGREIGNQKRDLASVERVC